MSYEIIRFVGERLGSPLYSKLIYVFLAYQLVVSALVFLFDSGFPPLLVIIGWALFMLLLAVRILFALKKETREKKGDREQERERMQRISLLKKRLENDPNLQTSCRTCQNSGAGDYSCQVGARSGDREFRFCRDDVLSYCLFWSPKKEEPSGGGA